MGKEERRRRRWRSSAALLLLADGTTKEKQTQSRDTNGKKRMDGNKKTMMKPLPEDIEPEEMQGWQANV
ncbi:unnamed protein product [Cuscuta campestris]|uniref:Uncharacterized protein n=1 Tax=Cuscuta campestris TaxID=132261 RepID=A0A484M3H0_9ASTE|nr:unnamed protein product [Cuscuta campestris]